MPKYFPIKTDTSCRLKWAWSTIYLNSGKTASCHRASQSSIDASNFENFHNTSEKLSARAEMLDGKWPTGTCEYCKSIEESGGISDRMFQNQIPEIYPEVLDSNPNKLDVQPVILEVFFSNACNLKCVYCNGSLSSSIQAENNKFGGSILTHLNDIDLGNYKELVPLFWKWFKENSTSLLRLQIAGGEPFLQKDFFSLIEYFELNPHPNLEFNVITNLNIKNSIVKDTALRLEKLSADGKVKRVDIQVSVDGWGKSQEYVRSGFNHFLFDENMKTIIELKSLRIGLLSTICSLNIHDIEHLVLKYKEWSKNKEIFWYMHLVLPEDSIFSPVNFDISVFEPSLNRVYESIPQDSWDQQQTLNVLSGIIEKLKQKSNSNLKRQQDLISYLEQNDLRRGLNWREYFPWLDKLVNE
jgi:sulfatase maturation enzyme AslB (radical SAM superfamily)